MNKSKLGEAIDLALDGKWDASHKLVQQFEDEYACWIHAILHRIEGDKWNSEYWYRKAGRNFDKAITSQDELAMIKKHLLEDMQNR